MGAECEYLCGCKARESSKIQLFPGSELPLLLDQACPHLRIHPQKQRQMFPRLLLLLHTPGGWKNPHLSRFGGRNRKPPSHRSRLNHLSPLKTLPGVFPDPKTSTFIDLFAQTPRCANHPVVPCGMGQGLAHPQGDWESSGSVSWKRPWIHFEGSGSGVGNALNQRSSRALPAHTPNSWDISPNPHPGWQNSKDERI